MELTHTELKSLVAPYVLGALSPEEASAVRRHMPSCEECMTEADGYSSEALSLLMTLDPMSLPEGFEDRVLNRVADERSARAPATAVKRKWSWALGLSFLALIVAAGALTVGLVDARRDIARTERALSVLASDEGIQLTGRGGATGRLVPTEQGSALVVAGLDEVPEGRTYQLWLMKGDRAVSVSTFQPSQEVSVIETPKSIEGFDRAGVTIEPAGGSTRPTTPLVMRSG